MNHSGNKISINSDIKIVLVHENDVNEGGCTFGEIMNHTPTELLLEPYRIYGRNLAVSLHSTEEYEKTSIRQILRKMGAIPFSSRSTKDHIREKIVQVKRLSSSSRKAACA